MTPGTKAKLSCPSYLVYGSATNVYAPFGSGWIPKNSDINYDIEIVDCNISPV